MYWVNRRVDDMLSRYKDTTDEVLVSALAILGATYGHSARVEQLAPGAVVHFDEDTYAQHVKEFLALDVVWPLKDQEGFVARNAKLLAAGDYTLHCVVVITPEQLHRSPSGYAMPFVLSSPTVWALLAPEFRKFEASRSYFVFAMVKPLMRGHDARHRGLTLARELYQAVGERSEDVELSNELINSVAVVLGCTRALKLVLSEEGRGHVGDFVPCKRREFPLGGDSEAPRKRLCSG